MNKIKSMSDIDREIDSVLDSFEEPKKVIVYKNKIDKKKLKGNLLILFFVFVIGLALSSLSIGISIISCFLVGLSLDWREIDQEMIVKKN